MLYLILLLSASVSLYQTAHQPLSDVVGVVFDVAFVTVYVVQVLIYMVAITILGKKCHENTRGTMFSLSSVFGSCGLLLIQYYGGYLYSKEDLKSGP